MSESSSAASLFDLRTVIALLFGFFGVVLTIIGIVDTDPAQLAKSGGVALNLWSGIVMIVISLLFVLWVRLRPPVTATSPAVDLEK